MSAKKNPEPDVPEEREPSVAVELTLTELRVTAAILQSAQVPSADAKIVQGVVQRKLENLLNSLA